LCEHKWVLMDTKKRFTSASGYQEYYIKVLQFYCEKCAETKEIKREGYSHGEPDWY
jgi:hypothetical protein